MAKSFDRTVGKLVYDTLIADINPPVKVNSGIIAGLTTAATYKRGTVLARNATDGKLYILGTTAEGVSFAADSVLINDVQMQTSDTTVELYTAGCFNPTALTVKDGYTITQADKDKLRERGIWLQSVNPAN
jgi:hypothetical protein